MNAWTQSVSPKTLLTQLIAAWCVFISSCLPVPGRKENFPSKLTPFSSSPETGPMTYPTFCLVSLIFPSPVASSSLPSDILGSPQPLKLSPHLRRPQPCLFLPFSYSLLCRRLALRALAQACAVGAQGKCITRLTFSEEPWTLVPAPCSV